MEGPQPCPSTENWIEIYWAWPFPQEQDPVFPTASPYHQEIAQASYPHPSEDRQKKQEDYSHDLQNKNHSPRKLTKMITWITDLCNSMKLGAILFRATQDGVVMVESSDRKKKKKMVNWRREWQSTSVFLPWEPHEQYEKAKRYDTERWTPQVARCPICYWRTVEK